MLGIGGTEFLIIGVFALLVFGPDKLPQMARTVGKFLREFRRYQAMMESTIRAEIDRSEDTTPEEEPAVAAAAVPVVSRDAFEDDDEEEEEE